MRRKAVKFMCLILSFLIVVSLFIGCGKSDDTTGSNDQTSSDSSDNSKSTSDEPNVDASQQLPIVKDGSVTLTIGTFDNWYAPASYADNLAIFQEIEKITGVKVNWDVVPPAQYATTMQTRIAAGGSDLPDIINFPDDAVKLGTSGIAAPLEDLIKNHAPNMRKFFAENPDVEALNVAPDGHVYKISSVVSGSTYVNPYTYVLRKDWLDKLGLKEPGTIDDWYNVLKAFKTQDPNGNNKDDEIPLIAEGAWYLARWAEVWGLRTFYSDGFYPDSSGKVEYHLISPKFKEYLTWMNTLYKEGLLDNEFASTDSEKSVAKINRNVVGALTSFISNVPSYNNNLKAGGINDANYVAVAPPKGPYGDQWAEGYGPISGDFGITQASKNKEVAIKWLDFVYANPEGNDFCMYGVEGKSYTREGGKIKMTDYVFKNPDGLGPFEALRALGSWPNVPYIQQEEAYKILLFENTPELKDVAAMYKPYVKLGFPPILATPEESEEMNMIMADMSTYREEMVLKFIIGETPLDDYDEYVSKMKEMGIDRVVEIKQDQWDRFQKALK